MGTSSKQLAAALRVFAEKQHGCFTAAQALELGYADSVHLYHVKKGFWERLSRGVYRLCELPRSLWVPLMPPLLWTRDRNGNMQGAFFGDTAEQIMAGVPPATDQLIWMAVPKTFRRSVPVPQNVKLVMVNFREYRKRHRKGLPVLLPPEEFYSKTIQPKSTAPRPDMDAPEYYDWLDYQANRGNTP
jgi:hypothetical protein